MNGSLIIAATDLAPQGDDAVRVAAAMAKATRSVLSVVHVAEPGHEESNLFENAKADTGRNVDVETIVAHASVPAAIAAHAHLREADLLVVGGCGTDGNASHRHIAEDAAADADCAVMVVRPVSDLLRHALEHSERLRIFAAVEDPTSCRAVHSWIRWLRATGVACDVVATLYYTSGRPDERAALVNAMSDMFLLHCEPMKGNVGVQACNSARAHAAHLVVTGKHTVSWWRGLRHGSLFPDLIRHSAVPVVCLPS